jgi:hypothetical protein
MQMLAVILPRCVWRGQDIRAVRPRSLLLSLPVMLEATFEVNN